MRTQLDQLYVGNRRKNCFDGQQVEEVLGVQWSSRRAFSSGESPKSISSNVKSCLAFFSKEGAKSFCSIVEDFTRGKVGATIACIAGIIEHYTNNNKNAN